MENRTAPCAFPGDPELSPELWKSHKINEKEQARVLEILGRPPAYAELGVFSVMWSEHCSYKSSRIHLSRLPTEGPRVIQGPGENAGVVDIGDGFAVVFKMESHNHPSFIEPHQGAATGVGGILRDVFTMGARPIATLNSLRFGAPEHPRTPELLRGVVAGIAGYGNCFGVPTVGGEVKFDARYNGNILVNAFACGVAATDSIFYGRAEGIGNAIFYVGARTGRDGIHGATMASDEFSEQGPSQRPTVQVGDPFMGKLLLEACLEIFAADLLIGIQDMGAAGLTSSSIEMASRSGSGIELDLDAIPRRARRLSPYEMLLSESQERMLMVTKPGNEQAVLDICEKWDLDAAIIGRVTDTGRWVVKATPGYDPLSENPIAPNPVVVCDLPVDELATSAPKYDRPRGPDPSLPARLAFQPSDVPVPSDWNQELLSLLSLPELGSQQWVWRQYDTIVRGGTVVRPGSDAGVVRVPFTKDGVTIEKWLAFSSDVNGRYVDLAPFAGGAMAVAEACRNVVVSGAEPIGLTDCLNFGNPENPVVMEQLSQAIDGMAAACHALGVPIVSGNVSLYNDTDGRPILPTPTIGSVGLFQHPDDLVPSTFREADDVILLFGETNRQSLGGSTYVAHHCRETKGPAPTIDLKAEAALQRLCLALARKRLVRSMHDLSEGGLMVALAECCVAHDLPQTMIGASIALTQTDDIVNQLLGEAPSRVVASLPREHVAAVCALAQESGVPWLELGQTGGTSLVIRRGEQPLVDVTLPVIREARESCLQRILGEEEPRAVVVP
jgi:phosphoribosylformylglycinamidine synthase subunit PurL